MEEKSEKMTECGTKQGDSGQSKSEQKNGSCEETGHVDLGDPVYKEISLANGAINLMKREELHAKCAELKLDIRGVNDVLKKRLKNYYKKQKLKQVASVAANVSYYDYICVVDFEATCEENNPQDYVHEIIEFPVVLVDTHTLEIVDSFQEYVKPQLNPQLSDFCVELTGITQKMVDEAEPFPHVLRRVVAWLKEKELGTKFKYILLTDGSWDMSKFLYRQCRTSRLRYPNFAVNWINIRKSYGNYYKLAGAQTRLNCMLENLGMQYEGRPHCGLDDSSNIARVAIRMLKDGCLLRVNECMKEGKLQSVSSTAVLQPTPPPWYPKSRA